MRIIRRLTLALAAVTFTAACASDSITVAPADDASSAVDVFTRLADSVARAGGDEDLGGAYNSLADAVRQGGRVSPVVITIDGVPTTFLATAQQTEIATINCDPPKMCPLSLSASKTLRSLIAWQQDDPKRVIQLAAAADSEPIRAYLFPVLVPFSGPSASLVYFDGKGGTYFGSSGAQKFGVVTTTETCTATGEAKPSISSISSPPTKCTKADFTVSFSAKAEPSSFLTAKNTATGSHTFSMAAQPVLGARFELSVPVPPLPPIKVTPTASLTAALSAKVDSVVTLTLTVTNATGKPVVVTTASGQLYDFTIFDAATGAPVWRWSDGMAFTMALGSRTLQANESLVFTERWKPAQKGSFIVLGSLVSTSHRADAKAAVTVP